MSPLMAQSGVLLRRANPVAFGAKRTFTAAARCRATTRVPKFDILGSQIFVRNGHAGSSVTELRG
jgi:hypothetical protein